LTEAVIMQIIGAAGETLLLSSLQGDHLAIRSTVTRFILFDSIGVLLLVAAWGILRKRIPGQE
jgi:hypothetical protein